MQAMHYRRDKNIPRKNIYNVLDSYLKISSIPVAVNAINKAPQKPMPMITKTTKKRLISR